MTNNMLTSLSEFKFLLERGLIKTHAMDTSVYQINTAIGSELKEYNINTKAYKIDDGHIVVDIFDKLDIVQYDYIMSIINNMGWYPTKMSLVKNSLVLDKLYDYKYITKRLNYVDSFKIFLESRFDKKIVKKYDKLYHLTPAYKVEKIFKIGLKPGTGNRVLLHPERVYFMYNLDKLNILHTQLLKSDKLKYASSTKRFIQDYFFDDTNDKEVFLYKYSLLEISNADYVLYQDPNFSDGCYTYDNIKPENIKIITN